jgi:hypothetical protein
VSVRVLVLMLYETKFEASWSWSWSKACQVIRELELHVVLEVHGLACVVLGFEKFGKNGMCPIKNDWHPLSL